MKLLLENHYTLPFDIYNLGSATGNTVLEVIDAFVRVNEIRPNHVIGPRRAGDVVAVYADNSKAREQLSWKLRYNLDDIVRTAWNWEKRRSGQN